MGLAILFITISYDIACQWKVNLPERMRRLPAPMQQNLEETKIQFGLPVFHAPIHNTECNNENHLERQPGTAKTDGEGIERVWSVLNPIAFSTKEMGLGHRADVIEDRVDNHNFLKNLGLGNTLKRRLVLALAERSHQIDAFEAVSEGVHSDLIKEWKRALRLWEEDHSQPNPFATKNQKCPTEAEIRLQLQREERQQNEDGSATVLGGSITSFLTAGIQMEDLQQRIFNASSTPSLLTTTHETHVEQWRHTVLAKLSRFRQLQSVYMPGAATLLERDEANRDSDLPPPDPEHIQLYMPSQMPAATDAGGRFGCRPGLVETEERLRVTQCENSLVAIRSALNAKRWLIAYRNAHLVGQKQTTKSAKLIESVTERLMRHVRRYRRGFAALGNLNAIHRHPQLRELTDADVRFNMDADTEDVDATHKLNAIGARRNARITRLGRNSGESRRTMSWVWTAAGALGDEEAELHESIRVEWTRALSRKKRWCEEVMLLKEEMRRVLRFLRWQNELVASPCPQSRFLSVRRSSPGVECTSWGVDATQSLQQLSMLDGMAELEAAHN
ncbi:CxC2 domain-containing protein [Mycena indigotica]|uniref:CxC2 domain-containing protein n=1 Tax=Mycena indigotica TaxID=2126181 RepID=A0A8H6S9S8_9AGAR|nr:CxC2 domain-containing protein [Mycena indigotica]KAF7295610.1 CxC2 domain-containing protein [Mycena indigotica]